ncbi:MAG: integrase core domain-containing protein [Caulobacteraceae bacterium]
MRRVVPALILRCHDIAFRLWWTWRSRHRGGGRPRLDPELIALIRQMSFENPLWGAPRIHGELLKLGVQVSQSSVSKYMLPRPRRATPGWTTFLCEHADDIASIDFLTVPSLTFARLYAFVVLAHDRHRILHVEVTNHPNAPWLSCQIALAFRRDPAPLFLVRDNDGLYGAHFRQALRTLGVTDRPTQPHSPWQNGHVERLIGSIRRECLDHVIVWNAAHLRRVLQKYADYYNNHRTHLALGKDSPRPRAVERTGRVIAEPILGGLHRRYRRTPEK